MKKFKILLSGLMAFSMVFVNSSMGTDASSPKTDKQIFAEYCDSIVQKNDLRKTMQQQTENSDDVYEAILKFVSNDTVGVKEIMQKNTSSTETLAFSDDENVTYDAFEEYLNSKGIFIYSTEEIPVIVPYSSGSSDVTMSNVMITYESTTQEWCVTGGGHWVSYQAIANDMPIDLFPYAGKKTNIGGQDAVGVTLYQTSGTKPTLKRCSGYIHDGKGNDMTLNNPYNLDSTRGVAFEYQDYKTTLSAIAGYPEFNYMGYGFAAQAIYDSKFAQYHGKARSYYAHTWKNTSIKSIGISTSGFNTSWSDAENRWAIYNNSEKIF